MKFKYLFNNKCRKYISKNRNISGLISVILVFILFANNVFAAINEDRGIVSAEIANDYTGRTVSGDMITNLNFSDVSDDYWGKEAIMRMGALDITKGYVSNGVREFRPTNSMSKEEALAFIMRSLGLEEEAKQIAEGIVLGDGETTIDLWSKGYLTLASQLGLITAAELADGLTADQTVLDPEFNFIRTEPVSRELISKWIVQGINSQTPALIEPIYRQQNVLTFDDFDEMDNAFIPYIEAIVEEEIMVGDGTSFNPKGNLIRAEMMQIMANMDTLLYENMGLVEKSGYVGHVETEMKVDGTGNVLLNKVLIRNSDGSVDRFIKESDTKINGVVDVKDAVVYRGDNIQSLSSLLEGDTIHYVVNEVTDEVYYVQVVKSPVLYHVKGALEPLTDINEGKITIQNEYGNYLTYTMADTLYNTNLKTIVFDEKYINISDAPITNSITLTIKNQLVTEINYGGTLVTFNEFSGLVIEHNTDFNYIRVSDWDGNEVVKRYIENQIDVEKEKYYDNEDQIGYFDQLFPYYGFDEDDAHIDEIEVGDIVHIKLDPSNKENILAISAKTNYTVKFGEILKAEYKGDEGYNIILKMHDHSVVSYKITDNIPVIKGSKNVSMSEVSSGDLVRILVNQAVIAPGTLHEGVKEINIDPNGNVIEKIYKGKLGTISISQETISILNSYELIQTGWKNYTTAITLDISKEDIEYYHEDERVTLAYVDNYLRIDDIDMYVATEKYFDKEKITKVTFRENRDSVLAYSNVTTTNGFNELETQNHDGTIKIDNGTIVVKNDKLISVSNVMAPDYTQVVLNGNNQAAVIKVKPEPNNDSISVMRGRIAHINDYEDFTVMSHALLSDMDWIYSPIERTYEIDYETIIKDEENILGINEFIGYSDISKVDEVYTIIAEGVKATHIIKGPYCLEGVIGEVFEVDLENSIILLKDTLAYDKTTKQWNELSRPNSYSETELFNESIIIKNNKVIALEELELGDRLRLMTNIDLAEELKLNDNRKFPGYIIYVE